MLNPVKGQEIGDSMYKFEGGDVEIVTTVQRELKFKAKDVMEVDESDDNTGDEAEELTTKQGMDLCQQMERLCIKDGSFDDSLGLARHLWQYQIHHRSQLRGGAKHKADNVRSFF